MAFDGAGVENAGDEIWMRGDAVQQIQVMGDADDVRICQSAAQFADGFRAGGGVDDKFGEHRVVVDGDAVPLGEAGVDAGVLRRHAKN